MKNSILRIALLFGLMMFGFCAISQEQRGQGGKPVTPQPENHILVSDPMPIYPGGDEQFMKDLNAGLEYPKEAKDAKIQGRVFIEFLVEEDGSITNVKVVRGIPNGEVLSEAAMSAVKRLKPFTPAMKDGKAISTKLTVPVMFKL